MGPYVFGNALLTGFFAFAALRFVMHWRYSRREQAPPVMALHGLLLAMFCPWIGVLATARTINQAQLAIDMRLTVGLILHVTMAWALWLATSVRAGWYVAIMAGVCLPLSLTNLLVFPINGQVTSLQSVVTTWGEDIIIPAHTPAPWMAGHHHSGCVEKQPPRRQDAKRRREKGPLSSRRLGTWAVRYSLLIPRFFLCKPQCLPGGQHPGSRSILLIGIARPCFVIRLELIDGEWLIFECCW